MRYEQIGKADAQGGPRGDAHGLGCGVGLSGRSPVARSVCAGMATGARAEHGWNKAGGDAVNMLCRIIGHKWHILRKERVSVDGMRHDKSELIFLEKCARCGAPYPNGIESMMFENQQEER
jgi:hypothetical protein